MFVVHALIPRQRETSCYAPLTSMTKHDSLNIPWMRRGDFKINFRSPQLDWQGDD